MKRISTPFPYCLYSCLYCTRTVGEQKTHFRLCVLQTQTSLGSELSPCSFRAHLCPPFFATWAPRLLLHQEVAPSLSLLRSLWGSGMGRPAEEGPPQAAAAAGSTCLTGLSPPHYHSARTGCLKPPYSLSSCGRYFTWPCQIVFLVWLSSSVENQT